MTLHLTPAEKRELSDADCARLIEAVTILPDGPIVGDLAHLSLRFQLIASGILDAQKMLDTDVDAARELLATAARNCVGAMARIELMRGGK